MNRIGAWLVGARGTLASTAVLGARAIAHGLADARGLVTELPDLARLPLPGLDEIVFGGWDVTSHTLLERARTLAGEDRAVPAGLVAALEDELMTVDLRVRAGIGEGRGPMPRAFGPVRARRRRQSVMADVEHLREDLRAFREEHRLGTVVVVNVASTEPPVAPAPEHERLDLLEQAMQEPRRAGLPPSLLYAYAALSSGCPYVNFTPSLGVAAPALQVLAQKNGVAFYGSDGKTGETLMKTVLAPLFRFRNLEVLSWSGFNILGGGDGQVLRHPRNKQSKLRSKGGVLTSALGYPAPNQVAIEYVESLGNWKTAWDHIHFRGFLGTKMSAHFIWQGCDAILAAPLVLDLVRLAAFAQAQGEIGPMLHLACFFKDPIGVKNHAFTDQFRTLLDYVERHRNPGVDQSLR
jgi:myo-inositol-1-phosphate synthase